MMPWNLLTTSQGTHKERSNEVSEMWWLAKRKFLPVALCIFICPIILSCTEKASVLDEDTAEAPVTLPQLPVIQLQPEWVDNTFIPCNLFRNCTELKSVYPHGVNTARLSCAKDRNKLDRDRDGWACE